MPKTNKERLQDNNLELQNIKTGIDNLPDYQDVIPVYDYKNYSVMNTKTANISPVVFNKYFSYYFYGSSYPRDHMYLNKINDDGSISTIFHYNTAYGIYIPVYEDEDNNELYYIRGYDTYLEFYKLNTQTLVETKLFEKTGINNYSWSSARPMKFGKQGICIGAAYGYFYKYDIENQTVTTGRYDSYTLCFNEDICCHTDGKQIRSMLNNTSYTSTSVINFINRISNKIIIDNIMYYLSDELKIGEKIKENVFENYNSNLISVNLFGDYYYIYTLNTPTTGTIYKFNEDTNTFEEILQLSNVTLYVRNLTYKNSQGYTYYLTGDDQSNLIAYDITGQRFYIHKNIGVNSNQIATGAIVYDYAGNQINGTMTNNGELNYTPSDSVQTIPAGYTSGGTVAAIDYSEQGALSPQDTELAAEQISDLFGEEENE